MIKPLISKKIYDEKSGPVENFKEISVEAAISLKKKGAKNYYKMNILITRQIDQSKNFRLCLMKKILKILFSCHLYRIFH